MKIIELQAENFKRLVAVSIAPKGNTVEITGRNGQGKSSTLDSIAAAIGGADASPAEPIRKGADSARVRINLGSLILTREYKRKPDGVVATKLTVTNADGMKFQSSQKMLDELMGQLSFDPLAFTRMKPREQFDAVRKLVPGFDFELADKNHKIDFDLRTSVNRQAGEARAVAASIVIPEGTPETPIDESALVDKLAQASEFNTDIDRRITARAHATDDVARLAREATEIEESIAELQERLAAVHERREATEKRLREAPPLPDKIDVAATRQEIEQARATNALVTQRARRAEIEASATRLEAQAEELTARIEKRKADRVAAVAAANLPFDGLEFGEGEVLLNGLPLAQASSAEQLRVSVALAASLNPKLRVILVRDGSLLDEDSLALLAQLADAADMQVWVERVGGGSETGFEIVDGSVRDAVAASTEAA